jgi:hypothetical protein
VRDRHLIDCFTVSALDSMARSKLVAELFFARRTLKNIMCWEAFDPSLTVVTGIQGAITWNVLWRHTEFACCQHIGYYRFVISGFLLRT